MRIQFHIFGTLYDLSISLKITKRVPKYVTVKPDSNWIYAGLKLKVDSVYAQASKHHPEWGRQLRLSLEGTEFGPGGSRTGYGYRTTVIREKDLIPHY